MNTFIEINEEMQSLCREIEILSGQLEESRTEWEQKKHEYELRYSGCIITGKADHPDWTQTDVTAHANIESGAIKAQMILAQGKYRKLRALLNVKNGRLEIVKELSWNLRAEIKRL